MNININSAIKLIKRRKKCKYIKFDRSVRACQFCSSCFRAYKSSRIKYLYISVPIFSLTSFIENAFQNIYPRHLSGGHTHLFTKILLILLKKNTILVLLVNGGLEMILWIYIVSYI